MNFLNFIQLSSSLILWGLVLLFLFWEVCRTLYRSLLRLCILLWFLFGRLWEVRRSFLFLFLLCRARLWLLSQILRGLFLLSFPLRFHLSFRLCRLLSEGVGPRLRGLFHLRPFFLLFPLLLCLRPRCCPLPRCRRRLLLFLCFLWEVWSRLSLLLRGRHELHLWLL